MAESKVGRGKQAICDVGNCVCTTDMRNEFHTFMPRAPKNHILRQKWISFILNTRKDFVPQKTDIYVCRHHFKEDQIKEKDPDDAKSRTRLKPGAIPTIRKCNFCSDGTATCKPKERSLPAKRNKLESGVECDQVHDQTLDHDTSACNSSLLDTSSDFCGQTLPTWMTSSTSDAGTQCFIDVGKPDGASEGGYKVCRSTQTDTEPVKRSVSAYDAIYGNEDSSSSDEEMSESGCDQEEEREDPDFEMTDEEHTDHEYHPQFDEMSDKVEYNFEGNEQMYQKDEKKYIVFEKQLMTLFAICFVCKAKTRAYTRTCGTALEVLQECDSCGSTYEWNSQPKIGHIYAGNILLSTAIFCAGAIPRKFIRALKHMGVIVFSAATYFNHQKNQILPVVYNYWCTQQDMLCNSLKNEKELVCGGDCRCDSPGHSAKYGSYSIQDLKSKKIIDVQLVQSNEVGSSNRMELEGLKRSIQFLTNKGVTIFTLITDGHRSIAKWLREKTSIIHRLDPWHVVKGVTKKILKQAKVKGYESLSKWSKSIACHLYWCSSSTPDLPNGRPDSDTIVAKWESVTRHITGKHSRHPNKLFPKCKHKTLKKRQWLSESSKEFEKLENILTGRGVMTSIRLISTNQHTSRIEGLHSIVNHFAPKMFVFSYQTQYCRTLMATLHYNENCDREFRKTEDGSDVFTMKFPKYKNGECIVRRVPVACTFRYVSGIMMLVENICKHPSIKKGFKNLPDAPKNLADGFEKPDKDVTIQKFKSRFNLD